MTFQPCSFCPHPAVIQVVCSGAPMHLCLLDALRASETPKISEARSAAILAAIASYRAAN